MVNSAAADSYIRITEYFSRTHGIGVATTAAIDITHQGAAEARNANLSTADGHVCVAYCGSRFS